MPYITSIERIGMQKGMEKGMEIGEQRGQQRGAASVLLHQIERRFGPPSVSIRERIIHAEPDTLLIWSERILDATTLDEILH